MDYIVYIACLIQGLLLLVNNRNGNTKIDTCNIFDDMNILKLFSRAPKATVEQIHKEFLTASETLLKEATEIIQNESLSKSARLVKAGFTNTVESSLSLEKKKYDKVIEVIKKYSITHPNNKVITHKQVFDICEKYDLIQAPIGQYKGFVPDKNLREIESFVMPKRDINQRWWSAGVLGHAPRFGDMFICAPPKDIELYDTDRIKNRVVVPDPVVLYAIEQRCYLIVTALGDESSDPIVTNHKMN